MKSLKNILILLVLAPNVGFAVNAPTQQLPSDVTALTTKIKACSYWDNADPWKSKERSIQIRTALDNLNCKAIVREEMAVRQKYQNDKTIVSSIDEVYV
ncbi:MAG: hypothetical protein K0R29_724 [Pseudobdellovibrio sp.]|nr:hypothetical protein [Pseudobdellovibrio sp.]